MNQNYSHGYDPDDSGLDRELKHQTARSMSDRVMAPDYDLPISGRVNQKNASIEAQGTKNQSVSMTNTRVGFWQRLTSKLGL